MADTNLTETQIKMLNYLIETLETEPKDIVQEFPMASKDIPQEKENYADYLALVNGGLIRSEKHGEWITMSGILAYYGQNTRSVTNVQE